MCEHCDAVREAADGLKNRPAGEVLKAAHENEIGDVAAMLTALSDDDRTDLLLIYKVLASSAIYAAHRVLHSKKHDEDLPEIWGAMQHVAEQEGILSIEVLRLIQGDVL